jgi:hypothetical protein
MSIDPVFWEIVKTPENNHQPLSSRVFGAWTVSVPAFSEVEMDEGALDAATLAAAMVQVGTREFERATVSLSLEGFQSHIAAAHARSPTRAYLAALVCALVLLDRGEEARVVCSAGGERRDAGGLQLGSQTFPELALAWLAKTEPTRH